MYSLHSWLRYAVFVLGLAALGYAVWGWARNRPYEKRMWDLASAFAVSLHVQIVLGFLLIFTYRFFSGPLGIHIALSMVAAAVAKVRHARPLQPITVPVTRQALVVGGGIAGISAALDLGDMGIPTYVVERDLSIGGTMAQLNKTFPTMDCSI